MIYTAKADSQSFMEGKHYEHHEKHRGKNAEYRFGGQT